MSSTAHPMIDAAVLAAIAEMPEVEIDWRAEYSRLYKAWRAAKDRLAQLENRHYFREVAKQLAKETGREVEIEITTRDDGGERFKAWTGASYTQSFQSIDDLVEHLHSIYCVNDTAELDAILATPEVAAAG